MHYLYTAIYKPFATSGSTFNFNKVKRTHANIGLYTFRYVYTYIGLKYPISWACTIFLGMSYLAKVKVRIEQMMKEQRQIFESYLIILDVVLFKEKYRRIISNTPIVLYHSFSCSCSVTSLLKFFWSWDMISMEDCWTKFLENDHLIYEYCLCGIYLRIYFYI